MNELTSEQANPHEMNSMSLSTLIKPHSDRVFSVPQLLHASECEALILLAEGTGFAAAGVRTSHGQKPMPLVRNNERVLVESAEWVALLWQRTAALKLPQLQGQRACGLPKDLRFYRYRPGQRFKMHKDGPWTEGGLTSRLTLLVYLNDQFVGGETDFRDFVVNPTQGDALFFIHDTWHEGRAVVSGTKYVLRSDVLYGDAEPS
jgi:predicted 2-oxoglutarate/Fe(II)-dependent dioxygenase YbiX